MASVEWTTWVNRLFQIVTWVYAFGTLASLLMLGLRNTRLRAWASAALWVGCVLQGLGLYMRFMQSGYQHMPWGSFEELLVFASWCLVAWQLVLEVRTGYFWNQVLVLPLSLAALLGSAPAISGKLSYFGPEYQSASYPIFAVATVLGFCALIHRCSVAFFSALKTRAGLDALVIGFSFLGMAACVYLAFTYESGLWSSRLLFLASLAWGLFFVAGLAFLRWGSWESESEGEQWSLFRRTHLALFHAGTLSMAGFLAYIAFHASQMASWFPSALFLSACSVILSLIAFTRAGVRALLPDWTLLERCSYRLEFFAFGLLTLSLLANSLWSYLGWGTYWYPAEKMVWVVALWLLSVRGLYVRALGVHLQDGRVLGAVLTLCLVFLGFYINPIR